MITLSRRENTGGFALLMTLMVIAVVVSVGLTVLDVTIKQVRLSANSRDSENAFQAASAGVECAQYWRRNAITTMESAAVTLSPVAAGCFGTTVLNSAANQVRTPTGVVNHFSYWHSWGTSIEPRCSQVDTIVMVSAGAEPVVTDIRDIVPGYRNTSKVCPAGSICTVIAARGYNRSCPATIDGNFAGGTVQREVLLEY